MKFIADVMLGSLAKALRLRGFDVLYDKTLDDNAVIRLSLEQQRVILTRDKALSERPLATNHLFITSEVVDDQLSQVLAAFPDHGSPKPLTRCSQCNERLVALPREEARDLVPEFVYESCPAFLRCAACGRVYWQGSHVERMGRVRSKEKEKPGPQKRNRDDRNGEG